MPPQPFLLVVPATRGLSLAITRHLLRTTKYPVYATYRSGSDESNRKRILNFEEQVDPTRLHLLGLDLLSEDSIASAADMLARSLQQQYGESYLHTAFFTGGILHPEKGPTDINLENITSTFQVNTLSHLLCIKHFSRFLPAAKFQGELSAPAKWVHVSARLGSISDNQRGGWFSYRSSKAALNQIVKTFDLYLKVKGNRAICVGVHPGTVKTDLSKDFWKSSTGNKLFDPSEAAEKVVDVVKYLDNKQGGKVWDWAGREVPW